MRVAIGIAISTLLVILVIIVAIGGYIFYNADGVIVTKYHEHEDSIIEYRFNEEKGEVEEVIVYKPDSYWFVVDVGVGYRTIMVTKEEWDKHNTGERINTKAHSFDPTKPFITPD